MFELQYPNGMLPRDYDLVVGKVTIRLIQGSKKEGDRIIQVFTPDPWTPTMNEFATIGVLKAINETHLYPSGEGGEKIIKMTHDYWKAIDARLRDGMGLQRAVNEVVVRVGKGKHQLP